MRWKTVFGNKGGKGSLDLKSVSRALRLGLAGYFCICTMSVAALLLKCPADLLQQISDFLQSPVLSTVCRRLWQVLHGRHLQLLGPQRTWLSYVAWASTLRTVHCKLPKPQDLFVLSERSVWLETLMVFKDAPFLHTMRVDVAHQVYAAAPLQVVCRWWVFIVLVLVFTQSTFEPIVSSRRLLVVVALLFLKVVAVVVPASTLLFAVVVVAIAESLSAAAAAAAAVSMTLPELEDARQCWTYTGSYPTAVSTYWSRGRPLAPSDNQQQGGCCCETPRTAL